MKMDIVLKSVLDKRFRKHIFQSPFIHTKLKIDHRLARDDRDYISEKCHRRYESREILSSCSCELFFYYSSQESREH